jgi:hypothetical protein
MRINRDNEPVVYAMIGGAVWLFAVIAVQFI